MQFSEPKSCFGRLEREKKLLFLYFYFFFWVLGSCLVSDYLKRKKKEQRPNEGAWADEQKIQEQK